MTCICGHHEAVHRAMCGAPEGCNCNHFREATSSVPNVQEARATLEQEIYDEMSGGSPGRDVRWPDALDTLIAAVRSERDAEIRGMVEGMRGRDHDGCGQLLGDTTDADAYLYRADVLRLLSDREGRND